MPSQRVATRPRPCIWMSAGLIRFKLCDQGFDCDGCPLDAAMRGRPSPSLRRAVVPDPHWGSGLFPNDRLYSAGHTWVQDRSNGKAPLWRMGLDTFAAALIGCVTAVRWDPPGSEMGKGDPICEIDLGLGVLALGAPGHAGLMRGNPGLRSHPEHVVTRPYGSGWIVELAPAEPVLPEDLAPPAAAWERARRDLRRFQRSVALRLLADDGVLSPDEAGRPHDLMTDLRQVLGGPGYVDLVGGFIH